MKTLDSGERNQVITKAVTNLKKSQFGVTAIKAEFEAQFNRRDGDGCPGYRECDNCDGNWEDATECDNCSGHGYFRDVEGEWVDCNQDDDDAMECDDCGGSGLLSCAYCDEGEIGCEGDCEEAETNFSSTEACHNWLMAELAALGLAEYREDEVFNLAHLGESHWFPLAPLTYAEFYNDGSVDSEFTVTVMVDNPENVFLLEKIERAFIALGEEIGNGREVRGAGMHIALLNTADGSYGRSRRISDEEATRFVNFKSSMQLLLPALYCLGASEEQSRGLSFRRPSIGHDTHRSAIDWRNGALEFRIFDTTYNHPERLLDNIVVISKCMRYWSTKKIDNGLSKITRRTYFKDNGGENVERFYFRVEHIDLLNQGLRKLKPDYLSISDIKEQRCIKVNKRSIVSKLKTYRKQVESEYSEYVERFNWGLLAVRHKRLATAINNVEPNTPMQELEAEVEQYIEQRKQEQRTLDQYVEQRINEYHDTEGSYSLCAD